MNIKPRDPLGLHTEFCKSYGLEAMQAIGAIVAWAHIRAPRAAAEQWGDVGLDRCGFIRWIQIDSQIEQLDGKFSTVKMGLSSNDSGGMKHLEASAGRFRLLFAHDADPQTVVPISEYAKGLTKANKVTRTNDLFAGPEELSITATGYYYPVLFHAKSDIKGEGPSILQIRFPDGEGGYDADHLNLYKLFPNLMDEGWLLRASLNFVAAVAEEKITEEALPKFRRASETGTTK